MSTSTATNGHDTNPAVLLRGPLKSSISTIAIPSLQDYPSDHVLLAIAYTGVCGSDVHFHTHGGVGSNPRKYAQHYSSQSFPPELLSSSDSAKVSSTTPGSSTSLPASYDGLVMGHEATAVVLQTGPKVKGLIKGDKVSIEPGTPCRTCTRCSSGHYNLCTGMRFAASFYESDLTTSSSSSDSANGSAKPSPLVLSTPGTLQKYYILPESLCYKLPPHINLQEGVLIEPLAVAVHAVRLAGITPQTKSVLITGAGTIGLVMAAVSCAYGAAKIVLVDIDNKKLAFADDWLTGESGAATKSGASVEVFNSATASSKETTETAKQLFKRTGLEDGAHVVLEASGSPAATRLCISALRTDGHMVQTGLSKSPDITFSIVDLSEKEIHLHGAFRYKQGDFETARDLLGRGVVGDVGRLVSRVWEFEEYEAAWKATRDGIGGGVKNLIKCPGLDVAIE